MSSSKLFSLIVSIIVTVIVGFIFISKGFNKSRAAVQIIPKTTPIPIPTRAQSTTIVDDTAKVVGDFREYVNNQYGFSLSYPYDWQILDEPNVTGIEIEKIDKQGGGFSISIRILDNPNNLSVAEFARVQSFSRDNGITDAPREVSIAGQKGYSLTYLPDSLIENDFIPYKDGKVMNIFAGGEFDKKPQIVENYKKKVDHVIQSLKLF